MNGNSKCVRRALVAGLTAVDPAAYGGWAGECPGCDVDAEIFGGLCRERGLATTIFHNADCTREGLLARVRTDWQPMGPGDLYVVFISGHGGQVPDTSGDETDMQDETLCLWDGELVDDAMAALWQAAPAGLRIFFVTDTCNSGTNYRYRRRIIRKTIPPNYNGQLIHFGGCADGLSSFGTAQGGSFTTALIDGWEDNLTYVDWFQAAKKLMQLRERQVPQYAEYGNVTPAFARAIAFE